MARDLSTSRRSVMWAYVGGSLLLAVGMSVTGNYVSLDEPDGLIAEVVPALAAWSWGTGVAVLCFWLHYLACRMCYRRFILERPQRPEAVLFAMLCLAAMHVGQMSLWGVAMYVADDLMGLGEITGETKGAFIDYLNFSMATYTSLGLGDITPTGWLKVLTGIETLTGLLCIGWSVSMFVGKMGTFLGDPEG